jgi:CBS domain-containing protein
MSDCSNEKISRDGASRARVADVMVARPKTLEASATVADLRRLFENPHVTTALLVDGTRFAGAIDRDALPEVAPDEAPAITYAQAEQTTITADAPMDEALACLDGESARRLVVLAEDGVTLRGLLCLDSKRASFCVEGSST